MKKYFNISKIIKDKTGIDLKTANEKDLEKVIKKLKENPDENILEVKKDFSIKDLNKKWYYRIIKVIWIFIFSIFILSAMGGIYEEYSVDKEKSTFTCGDGRVFNFKNGTQWGVWVEKYPFYEKIFDHSKREIEDRCLKIITKKELKNIFFVIGYKKIEEYGKNKKFTDVEISTALKNYNSDLDDFLKENKVEKVINLEKFKEYAKMLNIEKDKINSIWFGLEEIKEHKKNYIDEYGKIYSYNIVSNYLYMVLFWVLSIIGILILEQILRRIFYYIIFGTFAPKKD